MAWELAGGDSQAVPTFWATGHHGLTQISGILSLLPGQGLAASGLTALNEAGPKMVWSLVATAFSKDVERVGSSGCLA